MKKSSIKFPFFRKRRGRENKRTAQAVRLFGGDKRDRTADLLTASQALSPYKRVANPLKGVGRVLLVRRRGIVSQVRRFINRQ